MTSLLNKPSLFFLILFLASSSLGIHARESRFLMKATRPEDPKEGLSGGGGYGLYDHGQEQFTPTTTTNYNNNARPNANTFPSTFPDAELTSESHDNGGYTHGNHYNHPNNSPSRFSNEESNTRSYETKEYNNYVDSRQYGMSDTRSLENGRYYYDVGAGAGNHGNGVYGNGNAYEYNNAMEYQNNQVNQESQEEYVP